MRLGGDVLVQFCPRSASQMMGYALEGREGVIVIDGGTPAEAEHLEAFLLERGGAVEAWFLTHAHFDHIGAVTEILRRGRCKIKALYFDFPPLGFLKEREEIEKSVPAAEAFWEAVKASGQRTIRTEKGMKAEAGGFRIRALTEGGLPSRNINETTVVYRVDTRDQPILFLGDLEEDGEARLIRDFPAEIRCPVVQMAHHGQNGVSMDFYRLIRPELCLWPTPDWLWTNVDGMGPFRTLITRQTAEELGCEDLTSFHEDAWLR